VLDAVFTSNFLEHLPDKEAVRKTLSHAYRCLKPGGRFIAMGPNIKYVPGAYWDFFDHYVQLTELSLSEALREQGFEIETEVGRFLPYTMSRGRQYPIWMLRLYLAMPVLWPIAGRQFLVVGQKPF
jgi:SAM-dependent methyltransferase